MFRIKPTAALTMPLALLCSLAVAQPQPGSLTSTSNQTFETAALHKDSTDPTAEYSTNAAYTRSIPGPAIVTERRESRPFSAIALGIKADTLGAGIELATPIARSFNLRSSFNFIAFNSLFSVDGVNYDAKLSLRSSQTNLDWFPRHGSFHISPGILYLRSSINAPSSVPAGQPFTLGDQAFTNSVNDPVVGTAQVVFPRSVAPMLTVGFGNIIPRSGRHFSVPFEVGAAYTGAAQIRVTLNGTACTSDGCFTFADNAEAQASLTQEVHDINETMKRFPVYPILSMGLAYRF